MRYFIGDLLQAENVRIHRTHVSGLIACSTSLNPFEAVQKLKEFAVENPYQFRFAIKFTPLETCVDTDVEKIVEAAAGLITKIGEDDSFRVTVRRRHSGIDTMTVVRAVAAIISRRVDLDNPDWTVLVEIVGEWTGVSVLREDDDILSIMTMRDDQY